MSAPSPAGAGDPGLYGPSSVTWRLHADPLLAVAGLRALVLQALHPLAMAGVDQHSRFRADPWGRLTTTAAFVTATTYGTTDEARALGDRVRRVHRTVRGNDPETGEPYAAGDDALLLWVHCCLVDSVVALGRRAGVLDAVDADRYVAEQVAAARLVGVSQGLAPTSTADLADLLAGYRPALRVTPAARDAVARVVVPPLPPLVALATPARPLWASLGATAVATLPRWALRMYGLRRPPLAGPAATTALQVLRGGVAGAALLVPALREPPELRAARERLAG